MRLRRSAGHPGFPSHRAHASYTPLPRTSNRRPEDTLLYFAYTARIEPTRMAEAAPGASFAFIAHLADFGLEFPLEGNGWEGALPAAIPAPGSTVWGAVYSLDGSHRAAIDEVEASEGRVPATLEAIDRSGRRHPVVTHVADGARGGGSDPSSEYLAIMLEGSRHWGLPAGWIAGLDEHLGFDF